jgi:hypothetical protein
MSKDGAGVCCVLRALTCALVVACGSDGDGPARDEADIQLASADVSEEAAESLEAALCARFRDDDDVAETRISIRNERASAIYLVREPAQHECQGSALFALARAGARVNVRLRGDCEQRSCERMQDEGPLASDCSQACDAPAPLIRLEPGATFEAGAFDGEQANHGAPGSASPMPARCMAASEGVPDDGVACVSTRVLQPGRYRVSARAFTSLECDGRRSCECSRTAVGWCLLDRQHRSRGPALEAELELELPAQAATLTFRER